MKTRFLILAVILFANGAHAQVDKYDRAVEQSNQIIDELRAGGHNFSYPDMEDALNRIREWNIEMPRDAQLMSLRNRLADKYEKTYGVKIEPYVRKSHANSTISATSKSTIKWNKSRQQSPSYSHQPSAVDMERMQKARSGSAEVHKGTAQARDKVLATIDASRNFTGTEISSFMNNKTSGSDGSIEERRPSVTNADMTDGMCWAEPPSDPDSEADAGEPPLDIFVVIDKFNADESSLSEREMLFYISYLDAMMDMSNSDEGELDEGESEYYEINE